MPQYDKFSVLRDREFDIDGYLFEFVHTDDLHYDIYINGSNSQMFISRGESDMYQYTDKDYFFTHLPKLWWKFRLTYYERIISQICKNHYPEVLL